MTTFDISARQSGKTTRLLEWAKRANNRVIIEPHHYTAKIWSEANPDLAPRIITPMEARTRLRGTRPPSGEWELGIDEVDAALSVLLGFPVEYITATGELIHKVSLNPYAGLG